MSVTTQLRIMTSSKEKESQSNPSQKFVESRAEFPLTFTCLTNAQQNQ